MDKEFVPYQPSLDMKELGFDEPCFSYYKNDQLSEILEEVINSKMRNVNNEIDDYISAPTFSQAFRWFREKYDLDYSLLPESSSGHRLLDRTFNIVIYKYYMNMNVQSEIFRIDGKIATYNKREEAELECLKKLIEIVKRK